MNDIILSSLLNLLALFGSLHSLERNSSRKLITSYLTRHFGVKDPDSYVSLYEDLRDYYDTSDGSDSSQIVESICSRLHGKITKQQQALMLLRLMQFCRSVFEGGSMDESMFLQMKEIFSISDSLYEDFLAFIRKDATTENVLNIPYEGTDGFIKTLRLQEFNRLIFTFEGSDEVMMNDIPVLPGCFQKWKQSSVLKSRNAQPLYYSTIMAHYEKNEKEEPVELCGNHVDFRYPGSGDIGLHDFSFRLSSGQLVAIMGGSGAGKTTLLSLLNGTMTPDSGSVTINGHDISEPAAKALIGFVPQDDLLIEDLTVYQNLWYTAKFSFEGLSDEELDAKVHKVLHDLGLEAACHLKVGSAVNKVISGGQRKRLNIALELIREPQILFLDEPTSGLSSADTEQVVNLLKEQTYKGKLIITNIHQPSSDVFKMFDRLWLLDRGGYPIYDGNPIEAISYFKKAASYVDPEISACPTCGVVNPETVLNIIEAKSLDDTGLITDKRKTSPVEWNKLYKDSMEEKDLRTSSHPLPDTGQKAPGKLKQLGIFLSRYFKSKIADKQSLLISLFEAPALAVICALLTRYTPPEGYTVMDNKNLVSYFFMAIIVSIFLGMSTSAEEIFHDKAQLKREKFLHLSYGSYLWSKILLLAGISLLQTLLFVLVGNTIMGLHDMFFIWWMILFVSAFLSNLIGLLLSQNLRSIVSIYITIPLLLIPQILLCGLVVKFEDLNPRSKTGNVPVIGDVIPSRWAYEALAVSAFRYNGFEKDIYDFDREKTETQFYRYAFIDELRTQLEYADVNLVAGEKADDKNLAVLRCNLPILQEYAGMDPYPGMAGLTPESFDTKAYEDLNAWLDEAYTIIGKRSNKASLAMDKVANNYIHEHSKADYVALKQRSYNLQLENLVLNRDTKVTHKVEKDRIVPKAAYIFLTPASRCGRAPFYSGEKVLGNLHIPTLTFNMGVLLLMCLLAGGCLFFNFSERK